jgi:hypothetical protein
MRDRGAVGVRIPGYLRTEVGREAVAEVKVL